MNKELSGNSIALTKGANAKVREWYLKNLGKNNKLFIPSLNNVVMLPYVKEESREEGMRL